MSGLKVAVLGHLALDQAATRLSSDPDVAASQLQLQNFTRVLMDDGRMLDHLEFLKGSRPEFSDTRFSVWEIYLAGGLLLASSLRRAGLETKLINTIDNQNEDEAIAELIDFAPDILVLSTTFVLSQGQFFSLCRTARSWLPDAFIIAGGQHIFTTMLNMPRAQQRQYFTASGIDAFVNDSQGESALVSLCLDRASIADTPNVVWANEDGDVIHNEIALESNDMNQSLVNFEDAAPGSIVSMRTARSCAFRCAFCSYPSVAGELAHTGVEESLAALIRAKEAGAKAIIFTDDTFNVPRDRFEELIDRMIEADIGLPWYSFFRCQYADRDLVRKMRLSGCEGVFLGIESGSDKILKNMKKGAISRFYWDGLEWLQEFDIISVGAFVIGFPGETEETVAETVNFIKRSGLDFYFIQPFYYLHHAPIFKRREDFGLQGNGLRWSHDTMNWQTAISHIDRIFHEVSDPVFINPDYNLWEVAYLRGKGMSKAQIIDYRRQVNAMTVNQMRNADRGSFAVTSRDTGFQKSNQTDVQTARP